MNVTAAKDVPNVDQTSIWKGYFEAHFMSGKEINDKYPILNPVWKYSQYKRWNKVDKYDGYYYVNVFDLDVIISDPWFREFKNYTPIDEDFDNARYHTTVEGNSVLLVVFKKQ